MGVVAQETKMNAPWKRAYGFVVLVLIGANFVGSLIAGFYHVTRPFQLDYGEGIVIYQASRITDPVFAYGPIDRYPFVVYHYPPMFHWASRAMATVTGDLLLSGRFVSWVSGIVTCVLIGLIASSCLPRRIGTGVRFTLAAVAAALPLGYYNFFWTWLARTDALAIALAFGALTLLLTGRGSIWRDLSIAGLLVASLFTKQISIAAPAACLLATAVLDRARAVRLLLAMVVFGGAVLGGLAWFTEVRVLSHLFLYNRNPFFPSYALMEIARNLTRMQAVVGLAMAAMIYTAARAMRTGGWRRALAYLRATRSRRNTFVLAVYACLAGLVTIAVGKDGSNINYFLEWNFSLAPLAVLAILRWLPRPSVARLAPQHVFILFLVPFLLVIAPAEGWSPRLFALISRSPGATKVLNSMVDLIQRAPGPVFSEDMLLLHLAGKEVPAEPAIIQSLAASKVWSEEPLLEMIRQQKFSLIVTGDITNRQRWSPSVVRAIEGAYQLDRSKAIGSYNVYLPLNR